MNSIRRMYEHLERCGAVVRHTGRRRPRMADKKAMANIGGIQAGHPWRASRTPERADVFPRCARAAGP